MHISIECLLSIKLSYVVQIMGNVLNNNLGVMDACQEGMLVDMHQTHVR